MRSFFSLAVGVSDSRTREIERQIEKEKESVLHVSTRFKASKSIRTDLVVVIRKVTTRFNWHTKNSIRRRLERYKA